MNSPFTTRALQMARFYVTNFRTCTSCNTHVVESGCYSIYIDTVQYIGKPGTFAQY